jgi:alpha-galactosidase
MGRFDIVDELDVTPGMVVHEAGWQSWSPTGTYRLDDPSPRPRQNWQQLMRFRPGSPPPGGGFQSEGVLALDDAGSSARLYSTMDVRHDLDQIATIRVRNAAGRLVVSADGPVQAADVEGGVDNALVAFGDAWARACGVGSITAPPTVWCPWYHYFLEVTPLDIEENLVAMDHLEMPVDVVQVDDGWQSGVGDWDAYSERFRTFPDLVARIRDSGRRAGIWLAPFTVGSGSRLAREHPEWLVGEGGRNWAQSLRGLDVTHPEAADHLRTSLRALRNMGIDYVKLDFLYTGALPGRRHDDVTPVWAYRRGLALVREALGDDAYLLACGAPILPSVGLVDAMRVSADVLNPADNEPGFARLRGEEAIVARAWQQGRFWVNDPDCLVARPAFALRDRWADIIRVFGGLRSASDRLHDLDDWGVRTTRRLLSTAPPPLPFERPVIGPVR